MSDDIGIAVVKALGLPDGTTAMSIALRSGEAARITIEYLPDKAQCDALVAIIGEYELRRKGA